MRDVGANGPSGRTKATDKTELWTGPPGTLSTISSDEDETTLIEVKTAASRPSETKSNPTTVLNDTGFGGSPTSRMIDVDYIISKTPPTNLNTAGLTYELLYSPTKTPVSNTFNSIKVSPKGGKTGVSAQIVRIISKNNLQTKTSKNPGKMSKIIDYVTDKSTSKSSRITVKPTLTYPSKVAYPFSPSMYYFAVDKVTDAIRHVRTGVAPPIDYPTDYYTNHSRTSTSHAMNPYYSIHPVKRTANNDGRDPGQSDDYRVDYPGQKSPVYPDTKSSNDPEEMSDGYPEERLVEYSEIDNRGNKRVEYWDSSNERSGIPGGEEGKADSSSIDLDDFSGHKDGHYIEDPHPDDWIEYADIEPVKRVNHRHQKHKTSYKDTTLNDIKETSTESLIYPGTGSRYPAGMIEARSREPLGDLQVKGHANYDETSDLYEYIVDPVDQYHKTSINSASNTMNTPGNIPEDHSNQNVDNIVPRSKKPAMDGLNGPLRRNGKIPDTAVSLVKNWGVLMTAAATLSSKQTSTYGPSVGPFNCSVLRSAPIFWSPEQLRAFGNNSRATVALMSNCGLVNRRGGARSGGRMKEGKHENGVGKTRLRNVSIPIPAARPTVPAELVDSRLIFSQESPEDAIFIEDLIEAQQEYRRLHQAVEFDVKPKLLSRARKKAESHLTDSWLCSLKGLGCGAFTYHLNATVSPSDVAADWYAESEAYDFNAEPDLQRHPYVGLFTQMVWRSTMDIGCARFEFEDERKMAVVCLYSPPGNKHGEFLENVLPIPPLDVAGNLQLAGGAADGLTISNIVSVFLISLIVFFIFLN